MFKKNQEKLQQEISFLRQEVSNRLTRIGELAYNFLLNSNDLVNQTKGKVIKLNKLQKKIRENQPKQTQPVKPKTEKPKE